MKNDLPYERILLIRTDRIGDVVLTTPAIRALRQKFPSAHLAMMVNPSTIDLIRGDQDIDEILIDDRFKKHRGFFGFMRLVNEIRLKNFDIVVNFHTKKRTNLLCALSRIPRRVGYRNDKLGFLLTHKIKDVRSQGEKHEAQYCIDALEPLGVRSNDLTTFVSTQEDAEQWAAEFFRQFYKDNSNSIKCVALHLGASCPTKRWPLQYFADLVKMIDDRKPTFFIAIGGLDQTSLVADLHKMLGHRCQVYDLVGRLSLARTVSLLKRCDLLISNDSGPVHIAAAFNTPVVSIFTRNQPGINPERWKPLGEHSRYVAPPLDMSQNFANGEVKDQRFLYRVTPQQVLDVVDAVAQLC